jgi:ankyrin repeat protein
LDDIEALADHARAANHILDAEVAYKRVIDWYGDLGEKVKQRKQDLIMKVGPFFEAHGLKDQAEKCYLKIFDDIIMAYTDTPLHHAISNVHMYGPVSQAALQGIIRCCPTCRFKSRNARQQTPLHLAVSEVNEGINVAIMLRLRDPRQRFRIDQIHLDTVDYLGHTILTTAVILRCSPPLINALIKYGSNVNPDHWVDGPLTPLQAASFPGYEQADVAILLFQRGANLKDVWENSTVAEYTNDRWSEPMDVPMLPELDQPSNAPDDGWM